MRASRFSSPLVLAGWMAVATLPAAAAGPIPTIASTDDPANWEGISNPALDGEARIHLSGGSTCSGTLLSGGLYVLTAAHCLTGPDSGVLAVNTETTLFFNQHKASALSVAAAAFYIAPGWQGFNFSAGDGSDIALIKLATPVTSVAGYALSSSLDLGKTFMMAGYGQIGTGLTGATGPYGELHYGFNVIDTTDYALQSALIAQYGGTLYNKLGETYVYDFDNGVADQNAIQRLYGLVGISAGSNLGLGTSEAMIGQGDSGGGDFVLGAGVDVVRLNFSHGTDRKSVV